MRRELLPIDFAGIHEAGFSLCSKNTSIKDMGTNWHWYIYIIQCKDGLYYTGMTWDIAKRFEQHQSGKGGAFTAKHGVDALVYVEIHEDLEVARQREIQIKDFSRKKKEELIDTFTGL